VVDAYFIGTFVGAQAVVAVTLMFPLYMMLIALTSLVSAGFSSVYARMIGAEDTSGAHRVFASAFQLSLIVCGVLMLGYGLFGVPMTRWIASGSDALAGQGREYLSILIYLSPLAFILSLNIDALRAEGLLAAMAAITMTSALLNIGFDWVFVALLGWGVKGSAIGTVLSQLVSMIGVVLYRWRGAPLKWRRTGLVSAHWRDLLALGAPSSLGYVGLSISAGVTIFSLQIWSGDSFAATSGAFGIMTRLMTFVFLPLLGISLAFQTIVGNNFGAGRQARTQAVTRIGVAVALVYCVVCQTLFVLLAPVIGGWFVDDVAIQSELARILPIGTLTLFLFGPLMMIAAYFQATGDARRALLLSVSRTYAFAIPLTFLLPFAIGEIGIWLSGGVAELLVLGLTLLVLRNRNKAPVFG